MGKKGLMGKIARKQSLSYEARGIMLHMMGQNEGCEGPIEFTIDFFNENAMFGVDRKERLYEILSLLTEKGFLHHFVLDSKSEMVEYWTLSEEYYNGAGRFKR